MCGNLFYEIHRKYHIHLHGVDIKPATFQCSVPTTAPTGSSDCGAFHCINGNRVISRRGRAASGPRLVAGARPDVIESPKIIPLGGGLPSQPKNYSDNRPLTDAWTAIGGSAGHRGLRRANVGLLETLHDINLQNHSYV